MPITHEWNGTILTITSDSGSSSCDLKGEKGDDGARGPQGVAGDCVATDTPMLGGIAAAEYATKDYVDTAVSNVDLSPYATKDYVEKKVSAYNLLDNSDFRNPVNQRGYTSGAVVSNVYFIDRWRSSTNCSYTLDNNGMTIDAGHCLEIVSIDKFKMGEQYTIACKVGNEIICYTGTAGNTIGDWGAGLIASYDTSRGYIFYLTKVGAVYEWACMYEGQYTAENLPPYVPRGYAVELAECQRYAIRIGEDRWLFGTQVMGAGLMVPMTIPTSMRTSPTFVGTPQAYTNVGWIDLTLWSITYDANTGNIYGIVFETPEGANAGDTFIVKGINGLYADL